VSAAGISVCRPDPHGFMKKDEIVRYIEDYAASFNPPVVEGVSVDAVRRAKGGKFEIATSAGECTADQVVIAVGGYHVPTIPRVAERLPSSMKQISVGQYRCPEELPAGEVLVVGTGQSGCQIAEDLHLAGAPCTFASVELRARPAGTEERTSSIGSNRWVTTACRCTTIR